MSAGRRIAPHRGRAAAAACLALLALGGCERARQDMYDQPRAKPYGAQAPASGRAPGPQAQPGTLPRSRGDLAVSSSSRRGGEDVQRGLRDDEAPAQPYPVDMALLRQGRERYEIYCMPCHSPAGDGDGRIVRRGFPAPPSYHIDRLRSAPDRHLYEVIRDGYGQMRPYGDRLSPAERWAVVAYLRALQLSQHAEVDRLPEPVRTEALEHLPRREQR
ncbi:Cytochrome c [Pigmentiphaga humi]|uniref:Cytochrome c n=1 Tax=Pigmentiphaga humi TaxID=2478468 RepID=A0A3P4AYD7_9BURK|nr:cytochrome c [Pigmentiphaga humi]VCU68792.1 Cytochrome c [Pigmentiphaga humi]